ncbi:hypothetical protein LTR35_017571 [Friedmanniomyces endolithicus]|nr:hypothetical protein LTR35_017571 [Friedmanniomyces endolithicus]KAK0264052.1 hypothetical protein LTS00_018059 [Friedmanniomyces endolithicus]KAK0972697.1 hypothetical protein LTR54_017507 [Friedmanniomyces endolithicus]
MASQLKSIKERKATLSNEAESIQPRKEELLGQVAELERKAHEARKQADETERQYEYLQVEAAEVAEVDPIHVGLPWAGIRTILEAFWRTLSASDNKEEFPELHALWDTSDVLNCEEKCDTLSARASEEARLCDSEIGEQWRTRLDARLQSLEEIHSLQTSLTKLHDKVDLAKLETARGATYDSSAEGDLPRCLQGTQTELLERIGNWTTDTTGKHIFWLCGKAGTGKSTIARTIAQRLDEDGLLGPASSSREDATTEAMRNCCFQLSPDNLPIFFQKSVKQLLLSSNKILLYGTSICDRNLTSSYCNL